MLDRGKARLHAVICFILEKAHYLYSNRRISPFFSVSNVQVCILCPSNGSTLTVNEVSVIHVI